MLIVNISLLIKGFYFIRQLHHFSDIITGLWSKEHCLFKLKEKGAATTIVRYKSFPKKFITTKFIISFTLKLFKILNKWIKVSEILLINLSKLSRIKFIEFTITCRKNTMRRSKFCDNQEEWFVEL
jgi:hypothetical protein